MKTASRAPTPRFARGKRLATILSLAGWSSYRLYIKAFNAYVRREVRRVEPHLEFDPDLLYFKGGQPIFLGRPENRATLFFLDGFRILPAVGMHEDWLTSLHAARDVNVVAPVIGLSSLAFDGRNGSWDYRMDVRQALQVYDAYCSALPPDHRITLVSFSFAAVSALAIASRRNPDAVVLLSPLTGPFRPPRRLGNVGLYLATHSWTFRAVPRLMPFFLRREVSGGGWDIADPDLREQANRAVWNNREQNAAHVGQMRAGVDHMHDVVIPATNGKNIVVIHGDADRGVFPWAVEQLIKDLREAGNHVSEFVAKDSGHCVLMDRAEHAVKEIIAQAVLGQLPDHDGEPPIRL